MKAFSFALLSVACTSAFGASKIDLTSGSSTTINPGDVTNVTCENASPSGVHFCSCGASYSGGSFDEKTLVRIDFVNGQKVLSVLAWNADVTACNANLATHSACK